VIYDDVLDEQEKRRKKPKIFKKKIIT